MGVDRSTTAWNFQLEILVSLGLYSMPFLVLIR
jgi:hypothetical protein